MLSYSGCTLVFVDGAMTANFIRHPSESVIGRPLSLKFAALPARCPGGSTTGGGLIDW
jgi:hypothetical protein